MALPTISFQQPDSSSRLGEQFAGLKAYQQTLHQLIRSSLLAASTFNDWLTYWVEEERFQTFSELFLAFRRTLADLPEELREQASNHAVHQRLTERLPGKEERLKELRASQSEIARLIETKISLPLRSPNLGEADAECAASFNHSQVWYVIAMNTLLALSRPTSQEAAPAGAELLDELLEYTLTSSLESLHSLCEGIQLRELGSDPVFLTFHATITRSEDEQGYNGLCTTLGMMTCGETEEEVADLLGNLVEAYLRGEASLGTLPEFLASQLRSPQPVTARNIAFRIYSYGENALYNQAAIVTLDD